MQALLSPLDDDRLKGKKHVEMAYELHFMERRNSKLACVAY